MKKTIVKFWNDFLDLVFPRVCEACDAPLQGQESWICTSCRINLPRLTSDSMAYEVISKRFSSYPEVMGIHSFLVFTKKGSVQQLIYALKYRNKKEIGVLLGKMFALENERIQADIILPVPLHRKREKERGYNQSKLFSEGISEIWEVPLEDELLIRTQYTVTQTGKSKEERGINMSGVFAVSDPERLKGKSVILTDDVMTTGATLESCLETIVEAGCKQVYIITIAAAHH